MYRIIPLTRGLFAIIDSDLLDIIMKWKWRADKDGYAVTWMKNGSGRKLIRMHRFIIGVSDPKILVDHIDCNKSNNIRKNLRLCTPSENGMNRDGFYFIKSKETSSKYKGVSYVPRDNKWRAIINYEGIKESLGTYFSEDDAAKAYNHAAIRCHGEFAKINLIHNDN